MSWKQTTLGEVADIVQRRDVAVHRVQAFAQDQFWLVRSRGPEQLFEMDKVVMMPYLLLTSGLAHALNHGL